MKAFTVEVAGILHDLGAQVELDDDIELSDLQSGETLFGTTGPAHVNATVTNAGDGVVLHGTVRVALETDCVRCLEPFTLTIVAPVEGLYTTREKAQELPEDQEWYLLRHDAIDIAPAVESAIRLELPFAPLHSKECAGICPVCGCNKNTNECSCADMRAEQGPFDALKSLLDNVEVDT